MSVNWPFAHDKLNLGGTGRSQIQPEDADRQTLTAKAILQDMSTQPGVLLSDEVGMGKTYVALATASSVIVATGGKQGPVVIMVPSRLRGKWQREWHHFKRHCAVGGSLDWIRDTYAHSPTEFFKLLDGNDQNRKHLVFVTTGCFSGGLGDPWIKLAMIRLARRHTKLTSHQKARLYRWATELVRLVSWRNLTEEVVKKLMNTDPARWKDVLVREALLDEEDDDPIPELLEKCEDKIDWTPLVEVIRQALPTRISVNIGERLKVVRSGFNAACRSIYNEWLQCSKWYSPLLVLDEAHHAKNDHTLLARLFRQSSDEVALLRGKFQRMLFLTATPFQLGHQELIRVLKSFGAIRWNSPKAPPVGLEQFYGEIDQLEVALDANRLAGRYLDRLWGAIRPEMLGGKDVETWWCRVQACPADDWEKRLVQAVNACRETREAAQRLIRPWVVRHNRPAELPAVHGHTPQHRRKAVAGRRILQDKGETCDREVGLPIAKESVLPFLLTARAQGELARVSGARAFFAEGLASSYEAFHHTREARGKARDMDDNGLPMQADCEDEGDYETIVPTAWYEEQVAKLIPSRMALPSERLTHPKVSATVQRVVDLWAGGEKVLVFCFYRKTCEALYEHIREQVQARTIAIARDKLGGEYANDDVKVRDYLARIARRFSEPDRPFYREVRDILSQPFASPQYKCLKSRQGELIEVLAAYFRSPSFLARYLPLDDPAVQRAWELKEGRREVLEPALDSLRRGILEKTDQSNQTYIERVKQFLDFAVELAERAECRIGTGVEEEDDEAVDPLAVYLETVSVYSRPRKIEDLDRDDVEMSSDDDDGSYRVVPLVRMVHGDTKPETRERLALAFNSPLFPEILVSSAVMGEGIDLHRFCRHVIHHDGYWNPSTLEQQTGRVDRIRCKAEVCGLPIVVYQPFLAGSADEKMFRVVRDRERWFQIVMGQKFQFDEGTSEAIAARVPLPEGLAKELTFDLARWKAPEDPAGRR
jgi:hypothetical protein